jgi:hypothetical protein
MYRWLERSRASSTENSPRTAAGCVVDGGARFDVSPFALLPFLLMIDSIHSSSQTNQFPDGGQVLFL